MNNSSKSQEHVGRARFAYSMGAFGHDAFYALLSTYCGSPDYRIVN